MRNTLPCILMNGLVSKKILKIGKKDQHKDTNKTPLAPSAEGEKKTERLTFPIQAKNHGYLFFFIIYNLWATPRGSSTTSWGRCGLKSDLMLSAGNY